MGSRRDAIWRRILSRVQFVPNPALGTACWIWQGPTSGDKGRGAGYGRMSLNGQTVAVHLVTFTHQHGYIPGKKQVDHVCRNRLCCNPAHLELVTPRQNQKRRVMAMCAIAETELPPWR